MTVLPYLNVVKSCAVRGGLPQRVHDDVDEPGTKGARLCFLVVLHGGLLVEVEFG